MKNKTIGVAIAALSLAAVSGYSQGQVAFANSSTTLITTNNGTTGTAATTSTSGIKVQLFYQLNNGGAAPAAFNSASTGQWEAISTLVNIFPQAGKVSATLTTGTDVYGSSNPTGNIWCEAVAWNGNAVSLSAALGGVSTLVGYSTVWSQATGLGTATSPAAPTPSFTGIQLNTLTPVPEPTTIALAGMGAASLLLFRRRK